jgi:hypothetical protein
MTEYTRVSGEDLEKAADMFEAEFGREPDLTELLAWYRDQIYRTSPESH